MSEDYCQLVFPSSAFGQQAGSAKFGGHDSSAVVRRPRLLVGHFQKEQKSDLLGVSHVGKPIIPNKTPHFVSFSMGFQ